MCSLSRCPEDFITFQPYYARLMRCNQLVMGCKHLHMRCHHPHLGCKLGPAPRGLQLQQFHMGCTHLRMVVNSFVWDVITLLYMVYK